MARQLAWLPSLQLLHVCFSPLDLKTWSHFPCERPRGGKNGKVPPRRCLADASYESRTARQTRDRSWESFEHVEKILKGSHENTLLRASCEPRGSLVRASQPLLICKLATYYYYKLVDLVDFLAIILNFHFLWVHFFIQHLFDDYFMLFE